MSEKPEKKKINLTLNGKVREQLEYLVENSNATSCGEVVRKALDLLQKQIDESKNKS